MGKLKDKLLGLFVYLKEMFEFCPVTMVLILIDTVFWVPLVLCDGGDSIFFTDPFSQITEIVMLVVFGTFFVESIRSRINKVIRGLLYAGVVIVSVGLVETINYDISINRFVFGKIHDFLGETRVIMMLFAYCIILLALSIFANYKNTQGMEFSTYAFRVFSRGFLISVVYVVLNIGIIILVAIFTSLIGGDIEDILPPLLIIILGWYYAASLFHTIRRAGEDVEPFMAVLVRYVLFFMCVAAYIIIYIYMIKIVITWKFPSNLIFLILTLLFTFSMPVSLMCISGHKEDFVEKVARLMPVFFAPFIILQAMSMGMRIFQHGFTPSRYMAIVYLVFETCYIIWYICGRGKVGGMLIVLAACGLISVYLPGLNAVNFSKNAQHVTLKTGLAGDYENYSPSRKLRMLSAYDYLLNMDNGKQFLESHYDSEKLSAEINEIKELCEKQYATKSSARTFIFYRPSSNKIEIPSAVTTMESFCAFDKHRGAVSVKADKEEPLDSLILDARTLSVTLVGSSDEKSRSFTIDASDVIETMIDMYSKDNSIYEIDEDAINPIMQLEDGSYIYITNISLKLDEMSEEPYSVEMAGYVFSE